jgi:hypothetical protein
LSGLQRRFELPVLEGASYTPAYVAFVRTLVHLRTLSIPEDVLLDLWKIEKHLVQLLHFDTPSPTWFLDECGKTGHLERRLLLTHRDLGPEFSRRILQPQLDFSAAPHSLFSSKEVGDDVLRVLRSYQHLYSKIQESAAEEAHQLRIALRWFPRIRPARPRT